MLGSFVRPYAVTAGRTRTREDLRLETLIGLSSLERPHRLPIELVDVLQFCSAGPISVAELSARLRQPVEVAKILATDLLDRGLLVVQAPTVADHSVELSVLDRILEGVRAL